MWGRLHASTRPFSADAARRSHTRLDLVHAHPAASPRSPRVFTSPRLRCGVATFLKRSVPHLLAVPMFLMPSPRLPGVPTLQGLGFRVLGSGLSRPRVSYVPTSPRPLLVVVCLLLRLWYGAGRSASTREDSLPPSLYPRWTTRKAAHLCPRWRGARRQLNTLHGLFWQWGAALSPWGCTVVAMGVHRACSGNGGALFSPWGCAVLATDLHYAHHNAHHPQ